MMPDKEISRRLAAIVATDVAGYSRLMGIDEEGTLAAYKAHRQELIDPKIKEHGGRIAKTTGDGLLIEFSSVVDALLCCLDLQEGMLARNDDTPADRQIRLRVGVNLGDIIVDGEDIFGDGVNIAARLETIADPGGICISEAVLNQVKKKVALKVEDLGSRALRNIEEPVRAYRVANRGEEVRLATDQRFTDTTVSLPPSPRRPSLAILPFRNLSGDPKSDFIADGIGIGIETLLVQLSGLFLINATAHERYRDGSETAAEAVKDMPVRYALEGAVQQAGQQVRVSVQLKDLHENAVVWAEHYDRHLEDVFALQDDVTQEVISSLGVEILFSDLDRVWTRGLTGEGAWEYFLRGLSHYYKLNEHDNVIAREMFEKLYQLHPDKATGPAYIALTHWADATRGWAKSLDESIALATRWAEKSIDPEEENNGLGHVILGSIRLREGRFDEALALCQKGVSFRASCPLAIGQLAEVQLHYGDAQTAVKTAREALTLRMLYPPPLVNVLAMAYRDSGEIGLSIPTAREAARLDPGHTDALVTLCSNYALSGNGQEACRIADEIVAVDPGFQISSYLAKRPYKDAAKQGQLAEALRSSGLPG